MYRKCGLSWICAASVLALSGFAIGIAYSLATEQFGNGPLPAANYSNWSGIMPVINSQCRVYQRWVNGNENLFYAGNTEALNKLLRDYSSAKLGKHTVQIKDGTGQTTSIGGRTVPYNWEIHLVGGIAAHALGASDPAVIIYNDGKTIESSNLVIPNNIAIAK